MLRNMGPKTLLLANVASACIILYALRKYNPETTNGILHQIEGVAKWLLKKPQVLLHKWLGEWKKKKLRLPVVNKDITIHLSDDDLEKKFIQACNAVKMHRSQLKFDQWIYLYGLYKQIVAGDMNPEAGDSDKPLNAACNGDKGTAKRNKREENSYLMDAKLSAWKHCQGVSRKVCKFLYVQFVEKALPQAIKGESFNVTLDFKKTISKMKPLAEVLTGVLEGIGEGNSPTGKDNTDRTSNLSDLLCKNVVQANLQYIKSALKSNPYLINKRNSDGLCALHYACDRGYLDIVKLLIELGADINADDSSGDTALHIAAYSGKKDIIDYLTSAGADINRKNSEGLTFNSILSQQAQLY
ncbi:hypothetical protein C922_04192 [Plasmodium inui San Antonio 1]|uniref:ACB domain-containing protein n=1 Tax=Plasmodium inui San Antonio 1 TaxID=1237626 RepID=W6ZXC0_9APIC|nr:hypothetical protein C922_04192 [Plasmodium inui San Antonio 1]EUD65452.1 hypothetical protein C922_04192 [Plasmodium inui San Antonio 1]